MLDHKAQCNPLQDTPLMKKTHEEGSRFEFQVQQKIYKSAYDYKH